MEQMHGPKQEMFKVGRFTVVKEWLQPSSGSSRPQQQLPPPQQQLPQRCKRPVDAEGPSPRTAPAYGASSRPQLPAESLSGDRGATEAGAGECTAPTEPGPMLLPTRLTASAPAKLADAFAGRAAWGPGSPSCGQRRGCSGGYVPSTLEKVKLAVMRFSATTPKSVRLLASKCTGV